MQPDENDTNAKFKETFGMLSKYVTNQVDRQRGARQEGAESSRIHDFLKMNPPIFTSSSTTADLENFTLELKKVFEVNQVVRVELYAYKIKDISMTLFD